MSKNCDVIDIFSIYGQFVAMWKLESGRIVCKTYIFNIKGALVYFLKGIFSETK